MQNFKKYFSKKNLRQIIDFGLMPLGNGFISKKNLNKKEYKFSMKLGYNKFLNLVQLYNNPSPSRMFNTNYAFLSSTSSYMKKHFPSIIADGPIQSDFALNNEMLKDRFPFSSLNNNKVNTLIFPNLDSANIAYKLIKELNKALSIGPILMGLNQPVHILQLGASVEEIVNMAAIAVIDSQRKKQNK